MMSDKPNDRYLAAARRLLERAAVMLHAPIGVKLWDGSVVPLGREPDPQYLVTVRSPGVLGAILRRPSLEMVFRQYAHGGLDYEGGDFYTVCEAARAGGVIEQEAHPRLYRKRLKRHLIKPAVLRDLWVLSRAPRESEAVQHEFRGDIAGLDKEKRDEKAYIQFHYDLSNEFYGLFLDPEMQYSCAYFADWGETLAQAQINKLEMICRKLRLQPGERMLDIGCGWGGLLCHAVRHYDVTGHGVTLSQKQFDFAVEKVKRLGLDDRITIELRDYRDLKDKFDKIASIGMYEHIGIDNYPEYFRKVRGLLRDRGIFLNHGITRRAKRSDKQFRKFSPGRRLISKYIFPGTELDHIGHTLRELEAGGFEVHDVETWREHYALTLRHWAERLETHRKAAIAEVGIERYRMWIAYLAGVSMSFQDGALRIFQTVATKHSRRGPSGMPPTRTDLYERPMPRAD